MPYNLLIEPFFYCILLSYEVFLFVFCFEFIELIILYSDVYSCEDELVAQISNALES